MKKINILSVIVMSVLVMNQSFAVKVTTPQLGKRPCSLCNTAPTTGEQAAKLQVSLTERADESHKVTAHKTTS